MKTREKILAQGALTVLCLILFLGSCLPQLPYERKTLEIPSETLSPPIGEDPVSQTVLFPCEVCGIRIRFCISKGHASGKLYLTVDGAEAASEIPADELEDGGFRDILFSSPLQAGNHTLDVYADEQAAGSVCLWESAQDVYLSGSAYDADGYEEMGDWDLKYLIPFPSDMLLRRHILRIICRFFSILLFTAGSLVLWRGKPRREKNRAEGTLSLNKNLSPERFIGTHAGAVSLLLLMAVPTLLYLDFLLGDRLHLFNMLDPGNDSLSQTYPQLLYMARRLSQGQFGALYNFSQGLGSEEKAFFPTLTNAVSLFGSGRVAYLLGVLQWLRVVLAGWLAWGLGREKQLSYPAALALAFGYQMNSMLIARGAWETYPNIALLMIFWLYAFFRSQRTKRYGLYGLASFVFFAGAVLYDCVFYGFLLVGFLLWRHFLLLTKEERRENDLKRQILLLVVFAGLGMGDTVFHELWEAIRSPRMQEGVSLLKNLKIQDAAGLALIWITAFARSMGHSIMGISGQIGWGNFLDGPAFYCGIGAILSVPAAMAGLKGRKRAAYGLLLAASAVYLTSSGLRLVANGLAGDSFKLSSFWITLTLFLLWMEWMGNAPWKSRRDAGTLKRGVVWFSAAAAAAAAGMIALLLCGCVKDMPAWWISLLLIILYLLLYLIFGRTDTQHRKAVYVLFVMTVCAEAFLVPANAVNERQTCSSYEMTTGAYMDGTREALQVIDELEKAGSDDDGYRDWHRTEKEYTSVLYSDALAQDYYGTASYVGGTGIGRSVREIYEAYHLPVKTGRILEGSGGNVLFGAAADVKYLLTRENTTTRHGYVYEAEAGQINILRNENALPLAYVTDVQAGELERYDYKKPAYETVLVEKGTSAWVFEDVVRSGVLLIDASFAEEGEAQIFTLDENGNVCCSRFRKEENTHLELCAHGLTMMWFWGLTQDELLDLQVYCCDEDQYYAAFDAWASKCRKNSVIWQKTDYNDFEGRVICPGEGMRLATAIPWDENWQIIVDGKTAQTVRINDGFLGAEISQGEHEIRITYKNRPWIMDNLSRMMGCFLLVLFPFFRKNRACKNKRK